MQTPSGGGLWVLHVAHKHRISVDVETILFHADFFLINKKKDNM